MPGLLKPMAEKLAATEQRIQFEGRNCRVKASFFGETYARNEFGDNWEQGVILAKVEKWLGNKRFEVDFAGSDNKAPLKRGIELQAFYTMDESKVKEMFDQGEEWREKKQACKCKQGCKTNSCGCRKAKQSCQEGCGCGSECQNQPVWEPCKCLETCDDRCMCKKANSQCQDGCACDRKCPNHAEAKQSTLHAGTSEVIDRVNARHPVLAPSESESKNGGREEKEKNAGQLQRDVQNLEETARKLTTQLNYALEQIEAVKKQLEAMTSAREATVKENKGMQHELSSISGRLKKLEVTPEVLRFQADVRSGAPAHAHPPARTPAAEPSSVEQAKTQMVLISGVPEGSWDDIVQEVIKSFLQTHGGEVGFLRAERMGRRIYKHKGGGRFILAEYERKAVNDLQGDVADKWRKKGVRVQLTTKKFKKVPRTCTRMERHGHCDVRDCKAEHRTCREFADTGRCSYGRQCRFVHMQQLRPPGLVKDRRSAVQSAPASRRASAHDAQGDWTTYTVARRPARSYRDAHRDRQGMQPPPGRGRA